MKVGFTGTKKGMTVRQVNELMVLLRHFKVNELHHGDCIGADESAANVADILRIRRITHPPLYKAKQAFTQSEETRAAKPYLERNHDIVDETEMLFATPKRKQEELRSGTWSTIRYARKKGKGVIIIYPDGECGV